MIKNPLPEYRSLRGFIFFAILISGSIVFLGATLVASMHYENLLIERTAWLQEQLDTALPEQNLEVPKVTHELRLAYIASFVFFSLFFIAGAAYLSHLAIRRVNRDLVGFQKAIQVVHSAEDLKHLQVRSDPLFFQELSESLEGVNQLARRLEDNLVDKELLQAALDESQREDEMAADILYGHLIEKHAQDPLGIHHRIESSSHFSGDIILVRRSPAGSLLVLLADATGHGLSAAITMMPVISIFDTLVKKGHRLPYLLKEMNRRLVKDLPDDRFVAATLIELDPIDQELRVWNGGMPPALIFDQQAQLVERFHSKHMALGILNEALFNASPDRMPLPQQGYLFCCSDGLIEQVDTQGQAFGLQSLISEIQQQPSDKLIAALIQRVQQHAKKPVPDDDISLLTLDFQRLSEGLNPAQDCQQQKLTLPETPFEWYLRVQGQQLVSQAIPALMNEFLRTLGLEKAVIRKAFIVTRELTTRALSDNLLQLPTHLKDQLMQEKGEAGLNLYYQHKRQALDNLSPDSFLEVRLTSHPGQGQSLGYLEIQVRDNGQGQGPSPLNDEHFACEYLTLEVLEDGHFIKARF